MKLSTFRQRDMIRKKQKEIIKSIDDLKSSLSNYYAILADELSSRTTDGKYGKLDIMHEQGMSPHLSIYIEAEEGEEYDHPLRGMHCFKPGDYLKIFNKNGSVYWHGIVEESKGHWFSSRYSRYYGNMIEGLARKGKRAQDKFTNHAKAYYIDKEIIKHHLIDFKI